jgi:hypothetical protein
MKPKCGLWNSDLHVGMLREENQRTWIKPLEARERTNNQLNSHMTLSQRIEPGSQELRGEHFYCYNTQVTHSRKLVKILYRLHNINGLLAFLRRNSFYLVPG